MKKKYLVITFALYIIFLFICYGDASGFNTNNESKPLSNWQYDWHPAKEPYNIRG